MIHSIDSQTQIPFAATRGIFYALLGDYRDRIHLHDDWPIHIIMDRFTGKTTDSFVEYKSVGQAKFVFDRITQAIELADIWKHEGKLGSIDTWDYPPPGFRRVTLSCPKERMLALSLKAR